MPIRYHIQPELDLLLYVFEGEVSGDEYFQMYHHVYEDERRHHGMKILMDLRNGCIISDVEDFKVAMEIVRINHDDGFPPDHVAVVTPSSTMQHFINTMLHLADELPMYLSVFYNPRDAIQWLGLSDKEADVMKFWDAALGSI